MSHFTPAEIKSAGEMLDRMNAFSRLTEMEMQRQAKQHQQQAQRYQSFEANILNMVERVAMSRLEPFLEQGFDAMLEGLKKFLPDFDLAQADECSKRYFQLGKVTLEEREKIRILVKSQPAQDYLRLKAGK